VASQDRTPARSLRYASLRLQRFVTLSLEEFGASTLEAEADRYSVSTTRLAQQAVRYYLSDRDSGRMALRVPRLSHERARQPALELTLDLDSNSWNELRQEAERQEVSLERLLEHAIIYFLADLDAGRVELKVLGEEGG
jgi:hypothetical protein